MAVPPNVRIANEANAKMAIQRAIDDGELELAVSFMPGLHRL